ncbi:MAG TPA: hypothetical protein VIY51_20230 [Xanthobacteraceae bacterium]
MGTFRFIGAALAMCVATFFVARWLLLERPVLKPDPRVPTFHRVDVADPRFKLESSFVSDNDSVRDTLRRAVLDAADELNGDPCEETLKARYIAAATNYAGAWLSIAPCVGTRTCGQADSARLDLAQKAFGSPADRRVREAMQRVHGSGAIFKGDFPDNVARLVANLAHDGGINPDASPEYQAVAEALGVPVCHAPDPRRRARTQ